MVSVAAARKMALSLPEVSERPHFDRCAFRTPKRIFATLSEKDENINLMLSPEEQAIFCNHDKEAFSVLPNKWGLNGATGTDLKKVKKESLLEAMTTAWCRAAGNEMAIKYFPERFSEL